MNEKRTYLPGSSWHPNYKPVLTIKRLGLMAIFSISLLSGYVLAKLPNKLQLVLMAAVPAFIVVTTIISNPYLGIFYYFLNEYLRPVDFLTGLRPLRLSLLIEALTLVSWILFLGRFQRKLKWDKLNNLYIAFIAVMGLTVVTAMNNRYAFDTTQLMIVNFVIFLIATNIVNSERRLEGLIWLLLIVHLYHAFKGIYNYAIIGYVAAGQRTSGVTGSSFIGDENDFALALNVMLPFAYFYYVYTKNLFKKYLSFSIMVIFVLAVVSSMSRGGWVGLMAIIFYCIIKSKRKVRSLVITGALAAAIVLFAPAEYWQEVQSISDTNEATAQSRFNYWKAGVRMFLDNPLIGVGAGNGPIRMPEYVQGFRDSATQWGRTFHGTLPQVLGELGGLGFGLYIIMIIYALRLLAYIGKLPFIENSETLHVASSGAAVSIVGYMVTATFLSTAYYPQLWTLFAFTIILKYLSQNRVTEPLGIG